MRVEVTLHNGVTVSGHVTRFESKVTRLTSEPTGFEWACVPRLNEGFLAFIRPDEVDAVICYPESTDLETGQDERDTEAAQPGGNQVEPG